MVSSMSRMADALKSLIEEAIDLKLGNKEFSLSFDEGQWSADIGSTCQYVHLMEGGAEFSAIADTPEEAVRALIVVLRSAYATTAHQS